MDKKLNEIRKEMIGQFRFWSIRKSKINDLGIILCNSYVCSS